MNRNTKKWVDKKNSQTYAVVYRSRDDSQAYTEGERVLVPVQKKTNNKPVGSSQVKSLKQLEQELQDDIKEGKIRENEGEAALYGITFDDSKYDYMKHLKPIGQGNGVFVAKKESSSKKVDQVIFEEPEVKPVSEKQRYQTMQDIPDDIAGFKPDMDPRLREVLEALDDEEYVENDEDLFGDLLKSGEKSSGEMEEEEDEWDMDEYDGYETDDYEKEGDQGWEAGFRKFKAETQNKVNEWDSDDEFEDSEENEEEEKNDVLKELPKPKKKNNTKERKKKGAMTDTSSFSMSSSALFRNEGLTLLDDRFEKMKLNYDEEEEIDEEHEEFDMSKERGDFESLLDDFLENHELEKGGRRIVKKNVEKEKLQRAADSVSRGKLAARRKKMGW